MQQAWEVPWVSRVEGAFGLHLHGRAGHGHRDDRSNSLALSPISGRWAHADAECLVRTKGGAYGHVG